MTLPRPRKTLPFKHIGGPADGGEALVEVDDNDVPVEFYTLYDFTAPDVGIDPASGPASNMLYATYERESQLGDEGFEYVFRFRGQDVIMPDAA